MDLSAGSSYLARVADRARDVAQVDDVAVSRFELPEWWEVVYATTGSTRRFEEATFALGEGPTWDVWRERRPVIVSDVTDATSRSRWPFWSDGVGAQEHQCTAAFPVQIGDVVIGTFSLYRHAAGVFSDRQLDGAAALTDAVLVGLLDHLGDTGSEGDGESPPVFFSASVYQASGMVMAQLDLDSTEALIRLRAHAFALGRPLRDVADDVVARRIRFSSDDSGA